MNLAPGFLSQGVFLLLLRMCFPCMGFISLQRKVMKRAWSLLGELVTFFAWHNMRFCFLFHFPTYLFLCLTLRCLVQFITSFETYFDEETMGYLLPQTGPQEFTACNKCFNLDLKSDPLDFVKT